LKRQGYPALKSNPRKVTAKDFESADVVISIGCDLSGLEEPRGKLVRWDEVPPLSEDFARADEAIRKRVTELIEELVRTAPKRNDGAPLSRSRRSAWSTVREQGRPAAFATSAVDALSCGTRPVCPSTLSKLVSESGLARTCTGLA
jgi:hypothetical protein